MAGQPMYRELRRKIKDAGGDQALMMRVANGDETIAKIAVSFGVTYAFLYKYIHKDERRAVAFKEARRVSALARVEQAERHLDEADVDAHFENHAAVSHAKNKAEFKLRLASMLDRESFGKDAKPAGQTIQIGQLFVNALRDSTKVAIPIGEAHAIPPVVGSEHPKQLPGCG